MNTPYKIEPVAHIFPSDLKRFQEQETFCFAYSVEVGNPEEKSVPLYEAEQFCGMAVQMAKLEKLNADLLCALQFARGKISDLHYAAGDGDNNFYMIIDDAIEANRAIAKVGA